LAELEKLKAYDWPGNVRELRNILERALFLQKGAALTPSQLLEKPLMNNRPPAQASATPGEIKPLAESEQELIQSALAALSGNITRTAKALGISVSTLKRKLKEYAA
jgi:DNA-binding NtrC family response regulator